jgi:transglutaminase-like putative cysteine protease
MRLSIAHTTAYRYDAPVAYALQQVRLTPKSHATQKVLRWETRVEGGRRELTFEDCHRNRVELISFAPGTTAITVISTGEVELSGSHGVVGLHGGFMPLWMFHRMTPLTQAGPGVRRLAASVAGEENILARMHLLMGAVRAAITWEPGRTHVGSTAEEAVQAGYGVCQDHAHAFIACARVMGVPARYVSGYLSMEGRTEQQAMHAWAEVFVPDLGWVGFDPPNDICPDMSHVRVATGLDYRDAAPVSGMRFGAGGERLTVTVAVQQQ